MNSHYSTLTGLAPESEKQFQAVVVDLARMFGWTVYHTHDSRHSESGWPDLFMVRTARALAAEIKAERGKVSLAQQKWLDALNACGIRAYVWRPSQKQEITEILR